MNSLSSKPEPSHSRAVASGLLAAMFLLFLAATLLQARYPWLAYVQAFAEAAMVGGLADWFAVTALFRRPLGLPIPHTAVIPTNKDRIGESLGRFVETHFLPPGIIRARLAEVDFAIPLAEWLADEDNAARLADQLVRLLPSLVGTPEDDRISRLLREQLAVRLQGVAVAPLAGDILAALTADNRHQRLVDEALRQIALLVAEKEPFIRQKIRESTGWLWKRLGIDERAFNGIMTALEQLLQEVGEDAGHELRRRFDHALAGFIQKLRESPETRQKAEAMKAEIIASPAFQDYLESFLADLRQSLLADTCSSDSKIRVHLQAAVRRLGTALLADPGLRDSLNPWLQDSLVRWLESHRHQVARLIPDTIRTWDGDTMAGNLEAQVGKDLQFIRINGTLVGGLVGLAIHTISRLFGT